MKKRTRYVAEVTFTDTQVVRIFEALKRWNLYDNLLIILTADHGETFGEKHDGITEHGHGNHLYDTTQHVPLIIKLPGTNNVARRIPELVQLVGLAPTVPEMLVAEFSASFVGRSLNDLFGGVQRSRTGYAFAERSRYVMETEEQKSRQLRAIRSPRFKYIYNLTFERQELYEIAADAAETRNVFTEQSDLAQSAYQRISDTLGKPDASENIEMDPRVFEKFRSLGYVDNDQSEGD